MIPIEATNGMSVKFNDLPGEPEFPGDEKRPEVKFESAEFTPSPATNKQVIHRHGAGHALGISMMTAPSNV